ncbi:hypothetical protein GWK47_042459 [Chionoecetes opilio]|uniref:Uncharacterized protein n=1 Tax=Chionoecetes opilio TaxID=41210 RepID=A0A8J4YBE1_CHIOP|nr:hypothetical protein GWK47_042459 [Chionoecetes opilio]
MWQYLADYGTPATSSWTTGGEFTSRSSSSSAHDTKSLSAIRPPKPPSRKLGDREDAQGPEVSPFDPVPRTPSLLAHIVAAVPNHYEQAVQNLHWTNNPTPAFFSRHAPRLVEQLYRREGEQDDMDVAHA